MIWKQMLIDTIAARKLEQLNTLTALEFHIERCKQIRHKRWRLQTFGY